MGIMGISSAGKIQDTIVEKLFSDLYHGTYVEDDISIGNFRMYLKQLYNIDSRLESFRGKHSTGKLLKLALNIGTNIFIGTSDDDRNCARFPHWENQNLYVFHHNLSITIALCIVQDMRLVSASYLNSGGYTH